MTVRRLDAYNHPHRFIEPNVCMRPSAGMKSVYLHFIVALALGLALLQHPRGLIAAAQSAVGGLTSAYTPRINMYVGQ